MTEAQAAAIKEAIVDAIHEGANAWDAYAIPETEEASAKALDKIAAILGAA